MKPTESLLFEFLAEHIDAAGSGDVLYMAELHDTPYQTIKTDRGVRVSEAVGHFALGPEMVVGEFDMQVIVICYSRVQGTEKTDRQPALQDVFDLARAVFQAVTDDSTLGGRVCDSLIGECRRGYDVFNGEPFAVVNLPVVINPRALGNF